MSRRMHFAPVSGAPSTRLRLAAGYFILTGTLAIALMGIALAVRLRGTIDAPGAEVPYSAIGLWTTVGVGALVTGMLLRRQQKAGGIIGIGMILMPPVVGAMARITIPWTSLLWTGLSLLLLLSVWNELSDAERARRT